MSIKIDCPRCKTPLQVPNKLAGGYVNCPHCKGRLWVAKDAPADATHADSVAVSSVGGSVPVQTASMGPQPPAMPAPLVSVPPPAPLPRRKIARFITADAADSTLRLAADGKLPELHLDEGVAQQKREAKTKSVNPLVLLGALSMSVVLSIMLVLIDVGAPPVVGVRKKDEMRQRIEDQYFGSGTLDTKRLEPYQLLLREAQRAHTRGDSTAERLNYRKVLDMLRTERGTEEKGLTGSRSKDKELEEAISVLLSGG